MTTDRQITLEYLRVPRDAPWRWEEDGRVLVWQDGTTIAFREELQLIFERMAVHGLPPFPTLVGVLAACRDRYLRSPVLAEASVAANFTRVLTLRSEALATTQLQQLSRLPSDIIGNPRGKALLIQIVFESLASRNAVDANSVLRGLALGLRDHELKSIADTPAINIPGTIHLLSRALGKHTTETLRERLRTGLEALPGMGPELQLPRSERARRLLAALASSKEHRGLALVVRDLMAAIRLPNVLMRVDESASGGAAGLVNRGTLDRLLLSELAHDDLTLAARVALNEALYLHREPPVQRPQRSLALLLDAGLRLWGVPRVLAVATALALVTRWADDCDVRVWRNDGAMLVPVDLLDETALAAQLALLGTALDPGAALPAFSDFLSEEEEVDAVIVVHRETMRSPEFRIRLLQTAMDRGFLVLVDQDGLVQLHSLPWTEARPLAQVQVDLTKLFPPNVAPGQALIDSSVATDLPAIFRVKPFPLLLPISTKLERTIPHGEGGVCISSDRRLFQWENRNLGAQTRLMNMPGGRTCWLSVDKTGRIIVVRGRGGSGEMAVITLVADAAEPVITCFTGPHHPRAVVVERSVILVILHTRIVVVALDAQGVLAECPIREGLRWISRGYFIDALRVWFISWDGAQVRWDKIEMKGSLTVTNLLLIFDRDGIGPWMLTRDGRIISPVGIEAMRIGFEPKTVNINDQGTELIVAEPNGVKFHVVNLQDLKISRGYHNIGTNLETTQIRISPPSRPLQTRFQAIYAAPGEGLKLLNAKGRWLDVFCARQAFRLVESATPASTLEAGRKNFSQLQTPMALGCSLKLATWPGGARAWLDHRGLLHLRSQDQTVPELTLTLGMGAAMAGWTSRGDVCGPVFFTGGKVEQPPDEIARVIESFCNFAC